MMWLSKLSKLSKNKKIILLIGALGIITTSIVTPIVIINIDNDEISKNDNNKKDVQEVIKILEQKTSSQRKIKLASNKDGKIIAKNKQEIITKIKDLIGSSNLRNVSIEISIKEDKEISPVFEKIVVKISKGNYSQELSEDKTISVRRSRKAIDFAKIDVKEVANSLKVLIVKTVEIYIKDASALKITDNKNEILEKIKKLEGYKDIDFKGVNIDIKDSERTLPKNDQAPIPITILLSKNGFNNFEVSGFSAKQMSILEIAKIDVNHVKTSLENLNQKIIQVDTRSSSDQKISTNKNTILAEIKNLQGYSNIKFNGVEIEVKTSKEIIPGSLEIPIPIIILLSKNNFSLEVLGFKIKSLSTEQIRANSEIINLVKSDLENLNTKTVEVYTSRAIDLKITTNKIEILKAIRKLRGYSDIELKGVNVDIKNSETLLPTNDQTPITITLILSKPGISIELNIFKAKQMSLQKMANIDINFAKNALNSLKTKIVEINSFDSIDQKITTNKVKILAEIQKIKGYLNIDFNGVNVEVKDSETILATNDQNPTPIILVLSKPNALPNNVELRGFSAKQEFDGIAKIENKIIDKNILIDPNIATSNENECLIAIRNQLQKENPNLTNEDLLKISFDNAQSKVFWPLETGKRKEATLIITFNNRKKSINVYVGKGNSYLLLNSNVVNGQDGIIFQDKFGNLWTMGKGSKLQVLKKDVDKKGYLDASWTNNNNLGLTKNSNITDGWGGKIFQDSFGNLWTMGRRTKLQVLKKDPNKEGYVDAGWNSDNTLGLTKNSKILDGQGGTIFQDEFKNLWAMGNYSSLQVLKANADGTGYDLNAGWISDNSKSSDNLLKDSNIYFGVNGTIFQDDFGNLWAMGFGQFKLQVLKKDPNEDGYVNTGWTSDNTLGLTKNSNITNFSDGTIFQDSFGNLWSMAYRSKLQVLKANAKKDGYVDEGWTSANSGLTKNSNITKGQFGTIFQDDFGNLWAMGKDSKLQVLKVNAKKDGYVNEGWTSANSGLTKNSNITNGQDGTIFQDDFGNLWSMGKDSKLQVLKKISNEKGYVNEGWTSANSGLTKNLNITNGQDGTIFQDSFGNLWAMGTNKKLQVLRKHPTKKIYVDSWETF